MAFVLTAALVGLNAGDARAQRLWSVESVAVRPVAADRFPAAVAQSSATTGAGADPLGSVASVQVEYDYLRLGMGYLQLPLPDGSVIDAENAVFEDRGGGNLMWTGEVPGAGYESVLFTVRDGHLVGWFGEPGGPKYVVHAGPDGRGTVTVDQGPTGDWCGVETSRFRDLDLVAAAGRPASVASRSSGNRLDILVLHPARLERYWRIIGGLDVGIQQLQDYLNMVFRNGEIPATANLIPSRYEPEIFNRASDLGFHHWDSRIRTGGNSWQWEFRRSAKANRLIRRHSADMVVFMSTEGGGAFHLRTHFEPWVATGISQPDAWVLAHELGHGLGGHHDPAAFGNSFAEVQRTSFRPHIFGHTDLTSCANRGRYGDVLACPRTLMSYGTAASRLRGHISFPEPYYSSVRHKPNGWTIGVAGTSEVERLFHETVPVAARSGEEAADEKIEQYPRHVTARWTGRDAARLAWSEKGIRGVRVSVALSDGGNDEYVLQRERGGFLGDPWVRDESSSDNLTPILDGSGTYLEGVEIEGLQPGGRYRYAVTEPWRCRAGDCIRPLASDVVELSPPRAAVGAPSAPERLAARVTGKDSVDLTWQGASPGGGFEVWYRKWSGKKPHETWRRYGAPLPASARSATVGGLVAEEDVPITDWFAGWHEARRGRYSFVVVAYNDAGFAASETLDFELMPGPFPEATVGGKTPDCWTRRSGAELDGHKVYFCVETLAGERRRAWNYRLDSEQSDLLYFFDRDNVEVLVKVLDGCAVNGHRWVFVAPVTNLGFRLDIGAPGPDEAFGEKRRKYWSYDSARRPQEHIVSGGKVWDWETRNWRAVGNPQGRTARTVSDTTAFPCTAAEITAARVKAAEADGGRAAFLRSRGWSVEGVVPAQRVVSGARTDCEPDAAALTLAGGYRVSLCYETYAGDTGEALDYGLDSSQSGLLYFFERDNAEVLIKVLDGCGVNGHRWVFVAPVTDLAFNLVVESPDGGRRWTHTNRLGQTADAASDVAAFPCSA